MAAIEDGVLVIEEKDGKFFIDGQEFDPTLAMKTIEDLVGEARKAGVNQQFNTVARGGSNEVRNAGGGKPTVNEQFNNIARGDRTVTGSGDDEEVGVYAS